MTPDGADANLRIQTADNPVQTIMGTDLRFDSEVKHIYSQVNYTPIWISRRSLNDAGHELIRTLAWVMGDGVTRDRYHFNLITKRLSDGISRHEVIDLDMLLTDAYLSYARDLFSQKFMPKPDRGHDKVVGISKPQHLASGATSAADAVIYHANQRSLTTLLRRSTPQANEFKQLRQHFLEMRSKPKQSWPSIGSNVKLHAGVSNRSVKQLRTMLWQLGDLDHNDGNDYFDTELSRALMRFQVRHGLMADGHVGKETRSALNITPAQRAQQIAVNLKRWLRMPSQLPERYVMVNQADYQLRLMNNGAPELEMRVIVGKPSRRTPVLIREIRQLVFNPTWTVPPGIKRKDIIPKLRRDPGYIDKSRMAVYQNGRKINPHKVNWRNVKSGRNYQIVQSPGRHNALGKVKFVMPNSQAIFLHDTNNPKLFAKDNRALSSGCVRLEHPLELAEALLSADQGWNSSKVDNFVSKGKTRWVKLKRPVPVYLTYQTAFVDARGRLHFRSDIYKRDKGNLQLASR